MTVSVAVDSYYEDDFDRLVLVKVSFPVVEAIIWDQPFQDPTMPEEDVFMVKGSNIGIRYSMTKERNLVGFFLSIFVLS